MGVAATLRGFASRWSGKPRLPRGSRAEPQAREEIPPAADGNHQLEAQVLAELTDVVSITRRTLAHRNVPTARAELLEGRNTHLESIGRSLARLGGQPPAGAISAAEDPALLARLHSLGRELGRADAVAYDGRA